MEYDIITTLKHILNKKMLAKDQKEEFILLPQTVCLMDFLCWAAAQESRDHCVVEKDVNVEGMKGVYHRFILSNILSFSMFSMTVTANGKHVMTVNEDEFNQWFARLEWSHADMDEDNYTLRLFYRNEDPITKNMVFHISISKDTLDVLTKNGDFYIGSVDGNLCKITQHLKFNG